MKKVFKLLLIVVGFLLMCFAIYGIFNFLSDLANLSANLSTVDSKAVDLEWMKITQKRMYIVGFVDSLQTLALGLLCLFASNKVNLPGGSND